MISQDTDKKLFLLDAYALIFRAYYAFIRNPRINSKGLNTSAIFGFTNVLLDIINNEKPTHLAVVFDPPGGTFRNVDYAEYKANRDETPEDIKLSVPYILDIIKGFDIPVLMVEGFEADDVIGALAKKAEKDGFTTYMMTSDKDYAQLVSDNIFMFRPGRQGNPPQIWGIPEVQEKFGVERPEQVIDVLGMMGDSADNIPGIPGVGEKTAIKFIQKYGSMENLLASTADLKGKQKENVENNKEIALMSKHLATIVIDIEIKTPWEDLILSEKKEDELRAVFTDLEFRTLSKRVLGEDIAPQEGVQTSLFGDSTAPAGTSATDNFSDEEEAPVPQFEDLSNSDHDYQLISTDEEIKQLIAKLKGVDSFAFDTETSGLDPITADIVGMSFAWKKGTGYYVPTLGDDEEKKRTIGHFKELFEDTSKELVAQNFKYDYKVMLKYGVDIKNNVFDTMVAHYLINPDLKHGMDWMAETYLNYKPVSIETLIGKKGKSQGSMADLKPEQITDYASEDADITYRLKESFKEEIKKDHLHSLFNDVEIPLVEVLAKMELEGVNIDVETLRSYSTEIGAEIEILEKQIYELSGEHFNIDSPKQLGPILFDKLSIGDSKVKKTKSGQYSTSEDVLSKYKSEHEIIERILDYRQLRKLKSTYIDPLPDLVNPITKRVHTNYMQTVAATGRLSSNNPNLQNIPIRTARGREIRKAFIPRDENHILLAADYSQVELRIIAALSKDETMCQSFIDGLDIHAATASKVFGVPLEEVDREMRSKAKAVNFGIIYGQGAFGLAQNLGIRRGEAKEIIDNYYEQFSSLKTYQNENIEFARKNGYVETILKRRRYLKDINSANHVVRSFAERNAINAPIQGSAADVIKLAMLKIHESFNSNQFKSKMIMQVHDELVFDAHKDELELIKPIIIESMQTAVDIGVPLQVDMDEGTNWLEAH